MSLQAAAAAEPAASWNEWHLVLLSPWLDLTLGHPRLPEFEAVDPWLARPGLLAAGRAWAGCR